MPSSQAVWGIEVGQCALKAIRLRYDPESQKVEASAFDYIEHPKILSQPDADPDALSREAIQTFLSRNVVKGDRVVIGVPGQSGLARFIKLPPVEPSRIPEIVKYEARQQIPFALEEVVWDFQTIGQAEEAGGFALETEIGLFAMKRDLIYRFMNPFREAGVEVDVVQMRPLAVYNFASFDQLSQSSEAEEEPKERGATEREELLESAAPAADDEGGFTVLLDMGADNSDLVITDGTRIWQRNLPIGGNHFTRALTKELKLTFAKAEHLKRNATKAQDPRAIFQAMRPVFNDLVSEIQRSIGYFSSVHRQSKIRRIVGMGNAFKLPGLQKFLAQNLQYEVEKVENFRAVRGDQVLTAPAFQENILSFSVVYGLALQGLEVAGVRTNLLPPEITQARMIRRKKPWALSAAAILLAGFTSLFFGNWAQLHAVSSPDFAAPEAKAASAKTLQQNQKSAYDTAKGDWSRVKSNGEALTANVDKRLEWIEILGVISSLLPSNPANIDRTNLKDLGEVQITAVTAMYLEDVKADWFDRVTANPNDWGALTMHPLDKAKPPAGPGWLFILDGYHFNRNEQPYSMYALLDNPGFQSAAAREHEIKAAVLTANTTDQSWVPGSVSKTARNRRTGSSVGGFSAAGGSRASTSSAGASRGALPGNMNLGNMADEGSSDPFQSEVDDLRSQERSRFEANAGNVESIVSRPRVSKLSRTDFVLEFVWIPKDKSERRPASEWLVEMNQAGQPSRRFDPPKPPTAAQAAQPPDPAANVPPGNVPPGNVPPGNMPPGNVPPGNIPGTTPGTPGGPIPGAAPPANNLPGQTPSQP